MSYRSEITPNEASVVRPRDWTTALAPAYDAIDGART